jgi:hypothetical protein
MVDHIRNSTSYWTPMEVHENPLKNSPIEKLFGRVNMDIPNNKDSLFLKAIETFLPLFSKTD